MLVSLNISLGICTSVPTFLVYCLTACFLRFCAGFIYSFFFVFFSYKALRPPGIYCSLSCEKNVFNDVISLCILMWSMTAHPFPVDLNHIMSDRREVSQLTAMISWSGVFHTIRSDPPPFTSEINSPKDNQTLSGWLTLYWCIMFSVILVYLLKEEDIGFKQTECHNAS